MRRSAKPAPAPVVVRRGAVESYDEIESEFLGIWLGIARLHEKVIALASRREPQSQR
jgi:hypothetical protein